MNSARRLIGNIASLYVLQGANYLLPLIVLPYLVRVLGAEKFGLIAFAQALMQYFVLFTDYGFNLTATKKIANNRTDPAAISKVSCNVLAIKLSLLVLSFLILVALVFGIPKFRQDWAVYLVSYVLVLGYALFPLWFFQGIEQMRTITILNVIGKTVTTLGIFLLVRNKDDYVLAAFLQALGFGVMGVLGLGAMFYTKRIQLSLPTYGEIKEELADGWHVFISTAAVSLYTASNTFLLGIFSTNTVVGYFSAGDKVLKAINGISTPIFQSIYPYINTLFIRSQHEAKVFLKRVFNVMGIANLALSVLLFFLAPFVVHILFGKDFLPAIPVIRWMSILPFIVGINNIFGMQTMLPFGLNKTMSRILIAAGFFNLALIVPLIHFYSAQGAAISVTITEILVSVLMIVALRRQGLFFFFERLSTKEA